MNIIEWLGFFLVITIIASIVLHAVKRKETAKWKQHYAKKRSIDRSPYIRKDWYK